MNTYAASALQAAGTDASMVADLFWIMLWGAVLIWILTMALALYAVCRQPPRSSRRRWSMLLIAGGGVVVPTVVLGALLAQGLGTLTAMQRDADTLQIAVTGERFWWRVHYQPGGEDEVALANEIRLPVGRPAEILLNSPEVIHSFWIPALAGKTDMLPGRQTRLVLLPTRRGRFQGLCAEYCGSAHAQMAFTVDVVSEAAFSRWLNHQRAAARRQSAERHARGAALFVAHGCPACHTVRGTGARGVIGPDLTHVGSRPTLGAASLPMTQDSMQRWIRHPDAVKPGVLMPAFGMLTPDELAELSAYLLSLR